MDKIIIDIILNSIKELNLELDNESQIEVSETAILFGQDKKLDSLDFVKLVVIIEENIFKTLDKSVTVVSDKAFSKKYNPFANVQRMAEYIAELLKEENL